MESTTQFHEIFFKKHDYYTIVKLLLQNGQIVEIPLTGHCMTPLLCENDLITIQPIQVEQLCCGNVAIYHINGRLKAHRFIKFITINGQKHIITKSDRRYGYDKPVPVSEFLGIITQVKKSNRTINYQSKKWKLINHSLGKFSPYISIAEQPIMFFIRLPRKCASKIFKWVMGINYRAYMRKNIEKATKGL